MKRLNFKNLLSLLSLALMVSGCIAVWGASYKEVSSSAKGITFQFDPSLSSSSLMVLKARAHCRQYQKGAKLTGGGNPYIGIIEEEYSCVGDPDNQ